MNKKIAFITLGCKVNLYDTEAMAELFTEKGYEVVDFEEYADEPHAVQLSSLYNAVGNPHEKLSHEKHACRRAEHAGDHQR